MGAFLAFSGRDGAAPGDGFAAARAWLLEGIGLPAGSERVDVVHCVPKGAAPQGCRLATVGQQGWVVLAGNCSQDADTIGVEGLADLDGGYAVAIRDGESLTVQPDHLGRLHVYWAKTPNGVLVSTSSLALARATSPEPDLDSVREMLMSGNLFGDRTLFRSVRRMLGGRRYRFHGGRLDRVEALPPVPPAGPLGAGDGVDGLLEACRQACTDALRHSKHPLADLTGGLDSRIVLGLLLADGRSFEVTVTGPDESPDVRVAKSIAGRLGLKLIQDGPELGHAARDSFDRVLEAAALCDGEYDAIHYAEIAAGHQVHAEEYDASMNGSGGEVYRNYWWGQRHLEGVHDCVAATTPRFANLCFEPPFLAGTSAEDHFAAEIRRCLEGRAGDPAPTQLDHVYLHLRMQSWQGAIASATNRRWPNASPLMRQGPLRQLYALDPRLRLGGRLIHEMLRRLGRGLANDPLTTGFPPQRPGLLNAWRFLPGLLGVPAEFYRRLKDRRERRGKLNPASAGLIRKLFESGAADFLRPAEMASAPLFDSVKLAAFLDEARETGRVSEALLGRLIAIEFALRAASEIA